MQTQTRPYAAPFRPEFGNLEHIALAAPVAARSPLERQLLERIGATDTPAAIQTALLQQPGPGPSAAYLVGVQPESGFAYSVWVEVCPALYLAGLGCRIRAAKSAADCLEVTTDTGARYVFA